MCRGASAEKAIQARSPSAAANVSAPCPTSPSLGPDPRFGGGGARPDGGVLAARPSLGRDAGAPPRATCRPARRPLDAGATRSRLGRRTGRRRLPRATRATSGWWRRRRSTRLRRSAQRTPVLRLDRHRPRGRVGRAPAGPARLPPAGDPRQRARASAGSSGASCAAPTRVYAISPSSARERRPGRRARRGRRRRPADPGRPRRASRPLRTTSGGRRSRQPVLASSAARRPAEERRPPPRRAAAAARTRACSSIGAPPDGPLPDRVEATGVVPSIAPVLRRGDDLRPAVAPGGLRDRRRRGDGRRASGRDHALGRPGGARRATPAAASSSRGFSPEELAATTVRGLLADPDRLARDAPAGPRVRRPRALAGAASASCWRRRSA